MTNIIMNGCNGRMGRMITDIANKDTDVQIVAGIDAYDKVANDYPVFTNIFDCNVDADVIIDFSTASAVDDLLKYAVEKKIPVVLCTTGLTSEQLDNVQKASEKVAILKSANMSLGINTLMKILKVATEVLANRGYDIEIVEKHHNQKHLMHDNSCALFSAGEFFHRQLRPRFDFIADTPDHFQIPRFFRIDFDFFPDMPDVDSNCIVSANCFFIPDFLINLTDGKYFSFIFHEKQKNVVFDRSQFDLFPIYRNFF